MADTILNGDITVYYAAENNQKRLEWTGPAEGTRTLNEVYSALQSLFDDPSQMDDKVPMKADTPDIYRIQNQWFIDDTTVEHLTGGSLFSDKWVDGTDEHILILPYTQTTEFDDTDIGRTIQGTTTTDTGTLLDFNTTRKLIWVRPDDPTATTGDEFDDDEAYDMLDDAVDGAVLQDDNGTYTDYTTEANEATGNDVICFPATEVATEDAFVIGSGSKFAKVAIEVGTTNGTGTPTVVWQYWNGTTWTALSGVTDGTASSVALDTTGKNDVTFTVPQDWETTTLGGFGPFYYIRAALTVGTYTQNPLVDQVWIGGTGAGSFDSVSRPGESAWAGITSIGTIEADSHVYIYQQDPDKLGGHDVQRSVTATKDTSDWWGDGQIDILLKTKEADSVIGPDPQTPANSLATFFVRQYSKTASHFVATALSTTGGNTVVPFAAGDDLNNTTGYRNLIWDAGTTADTLVDEELLFKMGSNTGASAGNLDAWLNEDGGTFTEETSTANDQSTTVTIATSDASDAFYIGKTNPFDKILIDVVTAGTGAPAAVWQYWNGSAWTTLTVTDDTDTSGEPLDTTGRNLVTFTLPTDWAETTVTNQPLGFDAGLFYVRLEMVSAGYTVEPVLRNIWVAGEKQLTARVADTAIGTPAGATGDCNYYLLGDPISDFSDNDVVVAGTSGKDFDINGAPTNAAGESGWPASEGPNLGDGASITTTFGNTTVDINNGNGARPYSILINQLQTDLTLGNVYERTKYLIRRGSTDQLDGINGEEYLGNELQIPYSSLTGTFREGSLVFDQTTKAQGVVVADHGAGANGLILRNVKGSFGTTGPLSDAPVVTATIQNAVTENPVGTFADETADLISGATGDVTPWGGAGEAVNDAFYIGSDNPFAEVNFTVGTNGAATGPNSTIWEYWNGASWVSLEAVPGFSDGTAASANAFTAGTGARILGFSVPADWSKTTVGPDIDAARYYYIRCRVLIADYTTEPILDQATLNESATATIDSLRSITPVVSAPFGTFAGGKFFGAPGVAFVLANLNSGDVQNYQLIDDLGVTQIPPNVQSVTVSNLIAGDTVAVYRRQGTFVIKDADSGGVGLNTEGADFFVSHATANTQDAVNLQVRVASDPIPADYPTTGKVKIKTSAGVEHRYRYSSITQTTNPSDTFVLAGGVNSGTADGGNSSNTRLHDTTGTPFASPIEVGDYVWNETTGAVVRITNIVDNNNIDTDPLPSADEWDGDTYSINRLVQTYDETDNIYVPFLEQIATATSHSASFTYSADIDVKIVVRKAGTILPFEQDSTIESTGLTVPAIRSTDDIFT